MAETAAVIDASLEFNDDPRNLLRKFVYVGLVCLVVILVTATYSLYRVFVWQLIKRIDEGAPGICQVVMIKEKRSFIKVSDSGRTDLELPQKERGRIDRRLRNYLEPFGVDSMRIYDRSGRIVYATSGEQEGLVAPMSPELEEALSGNTVSRLETNQVYKNLENVFAGPGDQVVSYVPLWGHYRTVLGAFEIRKCLSGYQAEIGRQVAFSALCLGGVLSALFACVFFLVKKGTTRLARAQEVLHYLAITDPLTGIFNRREALARADECFSRRGRDNGRKIHDDFGCLMLDFDDFKTINDTYGHHVGDQVLQELAHRLKATLRPYDIVGRFGGEEFLVVMPETTLDQCREIADRLGRVVRERPFVFDGLHIRCSISIGGSAAHPSDRDIRRVLQRADEGLYQAKRLGKDRAAWCLNGAAEI